ncbi:MAG: hypothetical protein LBM09_00640 [Candidatus Nomurabacteria bacterium]|jgi:hypothetical protein|nr:hypothetical protein [Candidatus Nomurabacteria bacterium]
MGQKQSKQSSQKSTGKSKAKKGLIVGLVIGLVLIGGTAAALFLPVFNGGGHTIGSVDEFREAVKNRKAANCVATEVRTSVPQKIQANDGWSKVRANAQYGDSETNILLIEGDGIYTWSGTSGTKTPYDASEFEEFARDVENFEFTVECEPNDKADFSIPSDVNWVDSSNMN